MWLGLRLSKCPRRKQLQYSTAELWHGLTYGGREDKGQDDVGTQQLLPLSMQGPSHSLLCSLSLPSCGQQALREVTQATNPSGGKCRLKDKNLWEFTKPWGRTSFPSPLLQQHWFPSPPVHISPHLLASKHMKQRHSLPCLRSRGADQKAGHSLCQALATEISFCFIAACMGRGTKITSP